MTREEFFDYFRTGDQPTEAQFIELMKSIVFSLASTDNLPTASADNLGQSYEIQGNVYKSELVSEGVYGWINKTASTSGGTTNYNDLGNKPVLNNVQLAGSKTLKQVGIMPDFKGLSVIGTPDAEMIFPVGFTNNDYGFIYITDMAKFIAQYMSTVGSTPVQLTVDGAQDGNNKTYTSTDKFYLNTTSVYINGLKMILGVDYEETDDTTITFIEYAPVSEDRIEYLAIKK